MRILYIITQADGGGAQKYTLALAEHFGGAIAAGSEDSRLFDAAQKKSLVTFALKHLQRAINPWHDLLAVWEIRKLIQFYNPDIVHLNSTKAGIAGSLAAMGLKTKVVFTAHGFRFNEPFSHFTKTFYLALEKMASSYRDFIIAVSDADKNSALRNNLISPDKIKTIYNGITPIDFLPKEAARQKLGLEINNQTKIIGVIANSVYLTKGIDILEKASLLMTSNSLTIVIGSKLSKKIVSNDGKFEKLPYQPDVSKYLKAFDIFAMPSRKEGFPFGILEAMQAGLPIVASNVGGIPEALKDAGLLVEPESPEALARALDKLTTNPNLANQLAQKSLERSKLFTQDKMFEQTKQVYEKIMKN